MSSSQELFPYYLSKGKRERSTIVLNLPLAIVVLAQRNSITDVCISMFAYQGLKDAEKECDDVPKMTNDDISQYISDLVELKIPKLL